MSQKERIFQLKPDFRTIINVWKTMTEAARELGVTKQAIYDALLNETSCGGSYWMREGKWNMREAARNDSRKDK